MFILMEMNRSFLRFQICRNKKSLCPHKGTKAACFCGTTQIDEMNHPLYLHTIICNPLITEGFPVSVYSQSVSSCPRKPIRKNLCYRTHTTGGSLDTPEFSYFSCSKVLFIPNIICIENADVNVFYRLYFLLICFNTKKVDNV